jgi:hypothetical protein
MPRYFFNVYDGKDLPDSEGIELAGRNEAHRQAIITAGEMLRESDRALSDWRESQSRRVA